MLPQSAGYGRSLSGVRRFAAFRLALSEINNKTDGIADDLLPDTQLRYAHRDSKCEDRSRHRRRRLLRRLALGCIPRDETQGPSGLLLLHLR